MKRKEDLETKVKKQGCDRRSMILRSRREKRFNNSQIKKSIPGPKLGEGGARSPFHTDPKQKAGEKQQGASLSDH